MCIGDIDCNCNLTRPISRRCACGCNGTLVEPVVKAHPYAALMAQYAEDALITNRPWDLWECRYAGKPRFSGDCGWITLTEHPNWSLENEYRHKPRTININGHEVPEPLRVVPQKGVKVFLTELGKAAFSSFSWRNLTYENYWLKLGLIHSTKEAAELHAKALLSFTEVR